MIPPDTFPKNAAHLLVSNVPSMRAYVMFPPWVVMLLVYDGIHRVWLICVGVAGENADANPAPKSMIAIGIQMNLPICYPRPLGGRTDSITDIRFINQV